jgi:Flp pilus assembly protein TadG
VVAEFVLVGVLLTALVLAVMQLAVALHVRNTLADAAAEGARYTALVGATDADGVHRVKALIGTAIADDYAKDVSLTRTTVGGDTVIEVTVRAPLPALGLLGPANAVEVRGRATVEPLE